MGERLLPLSQEEIDSYRGRPYQEILDASGRLLWSGIREFPRNFFRNPIEAVDQLQMMANSSSQLRGLLRDPENYHLGNPRQSETSLQEEQKLE